MNPLTQPSAGPPQFNPYQPYQMQPNLSYAYSGPAMTQTPPAPPPVKGFNGRYIDDISEVRLDEVPMTGQPSIFVTKGMDAVYLKVWNANGQLLTARYSLDQNVTTNEQDDMSQLKQRLERLESLLCHKDDIPNKKGK